MTQLTEQEFQVWLVAFQAHMQKSLDSAYAAHKANHALNNYRKAMTALEQP